MTATARRALTVACLSLTWLVWLSGAAAPRASAEDAAGTVRADNLLQWQTGRDPTVEASASVSIFDQFDLEYSRAALRAGLRFESFRPSRDEGFVPARYDELTMKFVEWEADGLRLNVGNGFATLGRGLMFRAFELRGVVRDATFPPSQYVDSRSLDGVIIEFDRGPLSALAFGGEPVRYPDAPPGIADLPRRDGHVAGGHAALEIHPSLVLGAGYLRGERQLAGAQPELDEYASADLTLRAAELAPALAADHELDLQFYAEYAGRSWNPLKDGLETDATAPHALYTAAQLNYRRWGASFETKDYDAFALGWNDPPNLVPEMSQHLLNRMSHFLLADKEDGHQLSVIGALPGEHALQFDAARAHNEINGLRHYRLDALTLGGDPLRPLHWEVFAATGSDEVEGITDHRTGGISLRRDLGDGLSIRVAAEYQRAERTAFDVASTFDNAFLGLGVDRAGLGTLALQAEYSDDPDEQDDPLTPEVIETKPRRWLGLVVSAPVSRYHEATLFVGTRRGGTACTSGTCYLVPDFEGAELRLISRF
ncbi:MAG: hypothetical protein IPG61_14270 [bacterium]|nr:hypothetical protein [bacterium]MBK7671240.1 hypothetical protein [bacterium]